MKHSLLFAYGITLILLPACTNSVDLADSDGGSGGTSSGGTDAGGSSSGGSSSGGASSGGSSSGGSGNAGNQGGAGNAGGTGGQPGAVVECLVDDDCQLQNDCCGCQGLPSADVIPQCPDMCFAPFCDALQLGDSIAECRAGQCVAGFDCSGTVECAMPAPSCPMGETPSRVGGCWGACVPISECLSVADCTVCEGANMDCIENTAFIVETHCIDRPTACTNELDCSCAGDFCQEPYDTCSGTVDGALQCACIDC